MSPDQHSEEEKTLVEGIAQPEMQPLYLLPFTMQLQNTFVIEMTAKRFPVQMVSTPFARLGIEGVQIDAEHLQAQVILNVQIEFADEPRPFDISFKLLGLFTYAHGTDIETVRVFLEQGSLSVMLPFARELLINICTSLQVPPVMLTMVQLMPFPSITETEEKNISEITDK